MQPRCEGFCIMLSLNIDRVQRLALSSSVRLDFFLFTVICIMNMERDAYLSGMEVKAMKEEVLEIRYRNRSEAIDSKRLCGREVYSSYTSQY